MKKLFRPIGKILSRLIRLLPIPALRNPAPRVAVLPLHGMIGTTGRLKPGGLTVTALESLIKKAFETADAKAVAISINSPGGSPVQSSLIYKLIRAQAEKTKLPVYVFAEDVCASGGYWIACAGDEIYADESSVIGSIGVVSSGFGLQEFIKRHGIERRVQAQGEHKGMLDPFQPVKEEDVVRLRAIQKDIYEHFIQHVKNCRGSRLTGAEEEIFSGAFWAGEQAKKLGLIDGIGDVYSTLRQKYGENVKLIKIEAEKKFISKLLGTKTGAPLADEWVSGAMSALESRSIWSRFGL